MPENIRPQHPPKPANPASSMGAVHNVGGGSEKPTIRKQPQTGGEPGPNPAGGSGAVPNVGR